MEESRQLRVVVVDDERRPIGIISDGDLLRRSRAAEQPDFVARLRG
ncbi:MAG: CBS domain-containing protein, partial [Caldilinea sp.]|nr:CBS domain-containing protein [Caldilinea sp.]